MKSNLKFFLCFLLFAFAASGSLFAQNQAGVATLLDDYTVVLSTDTQVMETYEADASHYAYNMPDQQTADQFIAQFEREYVSVEVDVQTLKATVTLELNATTTNWSVEEWNQHLKLN